MGSMKASELVALLQAEIRESGDRNLLIRCKTQIQSEWDVDELFKFSHLAGTESDIEIRIK